MVHVPPLLAVIIPTLNAADGLPACLAALVQARNDGLIAHVIVSDGGSSDATLAIARDAQAQLVTGQPGRGQQLQRGADAATAPWLLFLHADTVLEPGWADAARTHMAQAPDHAAVFTFALNEDSAPAHRLARMVAWRVRVLGLPYGDQALLISRALYDEIGGYRAMPLMEDVDIVRRLGRRRLRMLHPRAITSARRYLREGYLMRSTRNLFCLSLYFLGVPAGLIKRIYG